MRKSTPYDFWARVVRSQPNECWPWRGMTGQSGYGVLQYRGHAIRAHRLAYKLSQGSIPDGMHILHRCDNPPCCNPAHLFAGTHDDNMADKKAKGRASSARGSRNGASKLDDLSVSVIKRLLRTTRLTQYDIADLFGVTQATINFISVGSTWTHVEAA